MSSNTNDIRTDALVIVRGIGSEQVMISKSARKTNEIGMLRVFLDTDRPEVRDWALDPYRQYREETETLDRSSLTY